VAPARFTLSVGTTEQFGTPVENVPNRDLGVDGVMAWYATPPPAPVDTVVVASSVATADSSGGTDAPAATTTILTAGTLTAGTSGQDSGVPVGATIAVVAVLLASVAAVVAVSRKRAPAPR
jgi:hypothetical protein